MKRRVHLYRAILVLLFLVFQEALFRAVFPLPEIRNFNRVSYSPFGPQEKDTSFIGARQPAMNATFRWNSRPDGATFDSHLNLYGFHDQDWRLTPNPGTERTMFVGDSLVEGFMTTDRETIPTGYARAAAQRQQKVEAMNFGIGGAGIDNYLKLIRDAVPLFRPNKIVLVFYANDLPYSLPKSTAPVAPLTPAMEPSLQPRLVAILRRAFSRQVVPRRWHGPARLFVPVVPDPANPWSHPSAEFSKIDPTVAEAMRRGDFNPFVFNLLNHSEMALRQPIEPRPALRAFQQIAADAKADLRLVYLPLPTQVSDYYVAFEQKYAFDNSVQSLLGPDYQLHARILAEACHELNIPFLDMTPLLKKAEATGDHLYWNFDEHPRAIGYRRIGATVEAWTHSNAEPNDLVSLN